MLYLHTVTPGPLSLCVLSTDTSESSSPQQLTSYISIIPFLILAELGHHMKTDAAGMIHVSYNCLMMTNDSDNM